MASTSPPEMQYRRAVWILVVLATILAFLAIFTSWVDRQALDTHVAAPEGPRYIGVGL